MIEVKLSGIGGAGLISLVDNDDYNLISKYSWHLSSFGYARARATVDIGIGRKHILMHRVIMGNPIGMDIDHISGNKLDNRRENLRVCTRMENLRNSKIKKTNTSGFKGVSWDKKRNMWRARITVGGEEIHIGSYAKKEVAKMEYDKMAVKFFGEFARL